VWAQAALAALISLVSVGVVAGGISVNDYSADVVGSSPSAVMPNCRIPMAKFGVTADIEPVVVVDHTPDINASRGIDIGDIALDWNVILAALRNGRLRLNNSGDIFRVRFDIEDFFMPIIRDPHLSVYQNIPGRNFSDISHQDLSYGSSSLDHLFDSKGLNTDVGAKFSNGVFLFIANENFGCSPQAPSDNPQADGSEKQTDSAPSNPPVKWNAKPSGLLFVLPGLFAFVIDLLIYSGTRFQILGILLAACGFIEGMGVVLSPLFY
jgi:hypothetical protein